MGPETRRQALDKLAAIRPMIGYPDKWRDYAGARDPARRSRRQRHARARASTYDFWMAKLGHEVDRDEWFTAPQTVNAYYSPSRNQIVFPAGILQPPFFDAGADDAANYGGIGAVIGHEISHAFDDQGSRFDGEGNLRNWWTDEDRSRFDAKTRSLVAQYDAFSPLPGYHVNGALTLGENVADNAGLAIAERAYRLSLGGCPAPVIDGYTGEQRLFISFAQIWRDKMRDAARSNASRSTRIRPASSAPTARCATRAPSSTPSRQARRRDVSAAGAAHLAVAGRPRGGVQGKGASDMRMIRFGMTLLCALPVLMVSAGAEDLAVEPGQWKVTSNTVVNGAPAQSAVKARCLTPRTSRRCRQDLWPCQRHHQFDLRACGI